LCWGDSGLAVCTDTTSQQWVPVITTDGANGAIIAWGDHRPSGTDASVYVQRVGDAVSIQENIKKDENIEVKLEIYPNPSKEGLKIEWQIPECQKVCLSIYDSQGRLIRKLVGGDMEKGTYIALWNGRDELNNKVPCGVYFCRLLATKTSKIKKINLAR
jgi:flagellar hook assembly protein FlgD